MQKRLLQGMGQCALATLFILLLSGCLYRMPKEDEIDVRPTTNNRNVISEHDAGFMPGLPY